MQVTGVSQGVVFRGTKKSESQQPAQADPAAANQKMTFYPAKPNRLVIKSVQQLIHRVLNKKFNIEVKMSEADKKRLHDIYTRRQRAIIAPNHSSTLDNIETLEIARQAGITIAAIGALESFEPQVFGRKLKSFSQLMRRLNVFSVDRANKDKSRTTAEAERIIRRGRYPFTIFPEGRITYTNLFVEPLKHGFAQYALNVVKDGKDVLVLPTSIYYHHVNDLSTLLKDKLLVELADELRNRLGDQMPVLDPTAPLPAQVNVLFDAMVKDQERQFQERYGVVPSTQEGEQSLDTYARLATLRKTMLSTLEGKYPQHDTGLLNDSDADEPVKQEVRARRLKGALFSEIRGILKEFPELRKSGKIEKMTKHVVKRVFHAARNGGVGEAKKRLKDVLADIKVLNTVINLTTYPPNYLPTQGYNPARHQGQLMEVFGKLERDVWGGSFNRGFGRTLKILKQAEVDSYVKINEPVSVLAFLKEQGIALDADNRIVDELSKEQAEKLAQGLADIVRQRIQTGVETLADEACC